MKKPQPFSLPARLQRAYDLLDAQPRTQADLAAAMSITQGNAATALTSLRTAELIRIVEWRRCPVSNRLSGVYGTGPAAEKPPRLQPMSPATVRITAERAAKSEARRAAREAAAAASRLKAQKRAAAVARAKGIEPAGQRGEILSIMREFGRMTAGELADILDTPPNRVRAMLSDLRYLRKVHVARWTRECPLTGKSGRPLAVFALGDRGDAKPPEPLTQKELDARNNRRRKDEKQSPSALTTAPASIFALGAMMARHAAAEARA